MSKFMGLSRAAQELGIPHRTLLSFVERGIIKAYRPTEKGRFLVCIDEVEQSIKQRSHAPVDKAVMKERLHAIVDRVRAEVAESKKLRPLKRATAPQYGQTLH